MLPHLQFLAPAKVNLSLRVVRKRDDGFHEIDSIFAPVSVFDRLDVELLDEGELTLTCDDPTLSVGEENLVVRAARLFCTEVGVEPQLRIHLEKHIPHGAGLGGGSSNAAVTLLALNQLFRTELPRETLLSLAADLGSDVPFFILGRPARARGRGEKLEPIEFSHRLPLLLIKPPFGVPTPWAYRRWRDSHELPGVRYSAQPQPWGELVNDLERPVFEKHLFLATLKTWLLEQPEVSGALMSGSGSAVFAVLHEIDSAGALGSRIAEKFGTNLWCHAAETLVGED
jgi:4-diphosphocytidyl-2-C-methyl-D-erythritol kinase